MERVVDDIGIVRYFENGKLHRLDGPAIEYSGGTKYWYKEGLLHREDGPAVEWKDGYKEWYIDNIPCFDMQDFRFYTENGVYIGIEKGKYGFEWVKFLTENEIKEFPIHPGAKEICEEIKGLVSTL